MKEIRLELKNDQGQTDTFIQKDIPMQKLVDAVDLQDQFEQGKISSNVEGITKRIELVASFFTDDRVTPEAILKGTDAREFKEVIENTINIVMGIDPETKKSETEKP